MCENRLWSMKENVAFNVNVEENIALGLGVEGKICGE